MTGSTDLVALLDEAADGDCAAFGRFYDHTVDDAHRLALAMLGDADRADRAVHDAYLDAWRRASTRSRTVSARAWLLTLVRGTARSLRPHAGPAATAV